MILGSAAPPHPSAPAGRTTCTLAGAPGDVYPLINTCVLIGAELHHSLEPPGAIKHPEWRSRLQHATPLIHGAVPWRCYLQAVLFLSCSWMAASVAAPPASVASRRCRMSGRVGEQACVGGERTYEIGSGLHVPPIMDPHSTRLRLGTPG